MRVLFWTGPRLDWSVAEDCRGCSGYFLGTVKMLGDNLFVLRVFFSKEAMDLEEDSRERMEEKREKKDRNKKSFTGKLQTLFTRREVLLTSNGTIIS